jgi:tetratricopeptide (TPR) repeat protein
MKRLTLTAFALLSLVLAGSLLTATAKDKWTRVQSKNFELVGNASDKEIRKVATRLEQFRDVFSRLLAKSKFTSSTPTIVMVFKDFDSYKKFGPPNTAGYFQPGEDRNYIALSAVMDEANDPFSTIFHEFVHLLIKNNVQNMPLWFNEGLAEYYSTFQIKDGDRKVYLGKVISSHVFTMRERKLVPLQTLFNVDHSSPLYNEKEKSSLFYAESWALVHYLTLNAERKPQLTRFLNLLLSGQSPDKAFPVAFGADYSVIEKELKEYVRRDSYPAQIATFEHKLEFDLEMQSTPLGEAEGEYYLGDLLHHTREFERAEKHLKKAIALDPKFAMAYASLGMLEMRRGKYAEAKGYLESASAANTGNYLIHYYYADVLGREVMGVGGRISEIPEPLARKIRYELKKAIELAPTFADSYRLLALVSLITNDQLDEAILLLRRAIELVPGEQEFALLLGQIFMRKHDLKSARETLGPIAESGATPSELRQRAKSLLNMIDMSLETEARYKEGRTGDPSAPGMIMIEPDSDGKVPSAEEAYAAALEQILPKAKEGEVRVRGQLIKIDCGSNGVTLVMQTEGRPLMLGTTNFEGVQFTSFNPGMSGQITCGQRKPIDEVVVVYRTSKVAKLKVEGEVISVTFVPKDFKLKQ